MCKEALTYGFFDGAKRWLQQRGLCIMSSRADSEWSGSSNLCPVGETADVHGWCSKPRFTRFEDTTMFCSLLRVYNNCNYSFYSHSVRSFFRKEMFIVAIATELYHTVKPVTYEHVSYMPVKYPIWCIFELLMQEKFCAKDLRKSYNLAV